MLFNNIIFIIIFLPLFFILFFLTKKEYRYITLFVASLIFYLYSGLLNLLLLIGIAIINYTVVLIVNKRKIKKPVLNILALGNLITLFVFKYNHSLILPLGISFYTFNNIMYIMDVKNGKTKVDKNPLKYLAYITCFVNITMGPMVNYESIRKSFNNLSPKINEFNEGLQRFIQGLIKKVLIADTLGLLYTSIIQVDEITITSCIFQLIIFGIQLFIDFSSYTDMALGLGKMIGVEYPENFNHPYSADSISDFWRRWHMSLTNFFKNYIYIPLGGNRVSKRRHLINLLIVWIFTGMWHGNTLNFVLWGLYYFIIQLIEKHLLKEKLEKIPHIIRNIYTLFFVFLGYSLFSIPNTSDFILFIKNLFTSNFINSDILFLLKENVIVVILGIILCTYIPEKIYKIILENKLSIILYNICLVLLFIVSIAYIVSGSYLPFLYNAF